MEISDRQKEAIALGTMRKMLADMAAKTSVPFTDILQRFVRSYAYDALFDFETEVWKEGPRYLQALFDESIHRHG